MTRPANETKDDLAREHAAKTKIEETIRSKEVAVHAERKRRDKAYSGELRPQLSFMKLQPHVYGVDWAGFRKDALVGWAEYKYRAENKEGKTFSSTTYETWKISYGKWMRLKYLANWSGAPFSIFFEWSDGIYWHTWDHLTGYDYDHTWMVNKRMQEGDREPAIAIPNTEFKKL